MKVVICGEEFVIAPGTRVSLREIDALKRAEAESASSQQDGASRRPFVLKIVSEPIRLLQSLGAPKDGSAARVQADGHLVRVVHESFEAVIDPERSEGQLFRNTESVHPLEITLRTVLSCRLVERNRLPLHAAGVVLPEGGVAFFGPSGAGKTTISDHSPFPVLSDELVIVGSGSPALLPSGFWGRVTPGCPVDRPCPLVALVSLRKGPSYELRSIDRTEAWPILLNETRVPTSVKLWQRSIAVIADLLTRVPVLAMSWSPHQPVWEYLRADLRHLAEANRQTSAAVPAVARGSSSNGCHEGLMGECS